MPRIDCSVTPAQVYPDLAVVGTGLALRMFVIDPKGTLIYNGAIDDKPTTDRADVAGATNYVSAALTEAMSGKPVTKSTSRPYGCSVKYGSSS